MMITTRSSISVKPRSSLVRRCRMLCIRDSFGLELRWARTDRLAMPNVMTLERVSALAAPRLDVARGPGLADIGLRRGLVRPCAEAEVRGDREPQQDPEDDDHDEELDQREALLLSR